MTAGMILFIFMQVAYDSYDVWHSQLSSFSK